MNFGMYSYFMKFIREKGIEAAADYAKGCGFSSVEFLYDAKKSYEGPDLETTHRYKEALLSRGLSVACVSCVASMFELENLEEPNFNQTETLCRYVDFAAEMESPFLHHTLLPGLNLRGVSLPPFEKMLSASIAAAEKVAAYAASRGISVLYEPQGFAFNGLENFGAFFSEMKMRVPAVGVCGDMGNTLWVDEDPADFIEKFAGDIRHVHIKDYVLLDQSEDTEFKYLTKAGKVIIDVPVGTGLIDFKRCFDALRKENYSAAISLEDTAVGDYAHQVAEAINFVKNIY